MQKDKCALLVIDMQQYCVVAGRGLNACVDPDNIPENRTYFFSQLANNTIPSIQTLLSAFRSRSGGEVIYAYIESLTEDGRDTSVHFKCCGFIVPK